MCQKKELHVWIIQLRLGKVSERKAGNRSFISNTDAHGVILCRVYANNRHLMTLMICLNNQSNRSTRQGERRKRLMMKTCCKADKQSLIYRSKHLKSFEIIETVDLIFNVCGYSFSRPQFKGITDVFQLRN